MPFVCGGMRNRKQTMTQKETGVGVWKVQSSQLSTDDNMNSYASSRG